jgi:sugar fermentation stimulation protein A
MFPDAVTSRGSRHVLELMDACKAGHEACVIFVVQRGDAFCLTPQDDIDPRFGRALREAVRGGVKVIACRCKAGMEEVASDGRIELNLQER